MSKLPVVLIKGDVNDADYTHSITEVDPEDIEIIKSIAKKISEFKPYTVEMPTYLYYHRHNFPLNPKKRMGEKTIKELYDFTEEEENIITNYFPHGLDGANTHTIHSIQIIEIKEELFKIDYRKIYEIPSCDAL
jgi:hypothetical protein